MSFTSRQIQNTFSITNSKGEKIPGDLVQAGISPILQVPSLLQYLGFIQLAGSFLPGGLKDKRGSTYIIEFAKRLKWNKGHDTTQAKGTVQTDEMLIHINRTFTRALEDRRFDHSLFTPLGAIRADTLRTLQGDATKVMDLDWYENLYKNAKLDKAARFKTMTLAAIKANPEAFLDQIVAMGLAMERKVGDHESFIGMEHQTFILSPEVMHILSKWLGQQSRSLVEMVKNIKFTIIYYRGYRLAADNYLGAAWNAPFMTGQDLDFKDVHLIHISHRIQYLIWVAQEYAEGRDPVFPQLLGTTSGAGLYGLGFNNICKDEVNFLVEKIPA